MRLNSLSAAFFCLTFVCSTVQAEPDLSGIWVLEGGPAERELVMTDKALGLQAEYDLLIDDPSLQCEPASLSRVWANPNSRFQIEQNADEVLISYELFDLRRRIPVGDASTLTDVPSTKNLDGQYFQKMGSSFARYENDGIFIETRKLSPGYVWTSRGIPQLEHTVVTEEFRRDDDTLKMTMTYTDETLFEIPFIIDFNFARVEVTELQLYNCEGADYDWFEKLNAPKGESQ
jgi:hypothetical protein